MAPVFSDIVNQMATLFDKLEGAERIPFSQRSSVPKGPGVYLFSDGEKPLYVGRTSSGLRQRMRGHGSGTHSSSTFAFLLARHETGLKATYKPKGGRPELMADPIFRPAFDRALERVKRMNVRCVEIADDHIQHVFELYAALRLGTEHNHFRTS